MLGGQSALHRNVDRVANSPRRQISGLDEAVVIELTESLARIEKQDLPLSDPHLLGALEGEEKRSKLPKEIDKPKYALTDELPSHHMAVLPPLISSTMRSTAPLPHRLKPPRSFLRHLDLPSVSASTCSSCLS